jgi:hypothetical protein
VAFCFPLVMLSGAVLPKLMNRIIIVELNDMITGPRNEGPVDLLVVRFIFFKGYIQDKVFQHTQGKYHG